MARKRSLKPLNRVDEQRRLQPLWKRESAGSTPVTLTKPTPTDGRWPSKPSIAGSNPAVGTDSQKEEDMESHGYDLNITSDELLVLVNMLGYSGPQFGYPGGPPTNLEDAADKIRMADAAESLKDKVEALVIDSA